jgi:hypothetical protein
MPEPDVPLAALPEGWVRDDLPLPELAQMDVVRHYLRLSQLNYGVDKGFYPLGSCTMKYNPKINEETARLPGIALTHPLQNPGFRATGDHVVVARIPQDISGFAAVSSSLPPERTASSAASSSSVPIIFRAATPAAPKSSSPTARMARIPPRRRWRVTRRSPFPRTSAAT